LWAINFNEEFVSPYLILPRGGRREMRPRVEGSRIGEMAEGAGEDNHNHNNIDCEGVGKWKKKLRRKSMVV
jgi:hypothetical protein